LPYPGGKREPSTNRGNEKERGNIKKTEVSSSKARGQLRRKKLKKQQKGGEESGRGDLTRERWETNTTFKVQMKGKTKRGELRGVSKVVSNKRQGHLEVWTRRVSPSRH